MRREGGTTFWIPQDWATYTQHLAIVSNFGVEMIGLLWPQLDIMRVLTVVESILLSMADPRADRKLSRHGSVRPPLQRGSSRTRSRLPRRSRHTVPI